MTLYTHANMTKKIDFNQKWNELVKFLTERKKNNELPPLDPEVMGHLGFSPQAWRIWKPQFLTLAQRPIEILRNEQGQMTNIFYIRYDSSSKEWSVDMVKNHLE